MRLNPMALALAFGVAKVAVFIFSTLAISTMPWITTIGMFRSPFPRLPFMLDYRFVLFQIVIGFVGGAIAGWLSAVIYNKVIARGGQAA